MEDPYSMMGSLDSPIKCMENLNSSVGVPDKLVRCIENSDSSVNCLDNTFNTLLSSLNFRPSHPSFPCTYLDISPNYMNSQFTLVGCLDFSPNYPDVLSILEYSTLILSTILAWDMTHYLPSSYFVDFEIQYMCFK